MTKLKGGHLYSTVRMLPVPKLNIDYSALELKMLAMYPEIRHYIEKVPSLVRPVSDDTEFKKPVYINKPLLFSGVVHIVASVQDLGDIEPSTWRWRTWCGITVDQPGYDKLNLTPTCLGCIANKE